VVIQDNCIKFYCSLPWPSGPKGRGIQKPLPFIHLLNLTKIKDLNSNYNIFNKLDPGTKGQLQKVFKCDMTKLVSLNVDFHKLSGNHFSW